MIIFFRLTSKDNEPITENIFKPYPKNSVGLRIPNLEIVSVTKLPPTSLKTTLYKSTFDIVVKTDEVAPYVWIEAEGEIPSQSLNLFSLHLHKQRTYTYCNRWILSYHLIPRRSHVSNPRRHVTNQCLISRDAP